MSDEPALMDHEARIKMLEAQLEALIRLCEKEGILVKNEVDDQVKEILEGRS